VSDEFRSSDDFAPNTADTIKAEIEAGTLDDLPDVLVIHVRKPPSNDFADTMRAAGRLRLVPADDDPHVMMQFVDDDLVAIYVRHVAEIMGAQEVGGAIGELLLRLNEDARERGLGEVQFMLEEGPRSPAEAGFASEPILFLDDEDEDGEPRVH